MPKATQYTTQTCGYCKIEHASATRQLFNFFVDNDVLSLVRFTEETFAALLRFREALSKDDKGNISAILSKVFIVGKVKVRVVR